MSNTFPCVDFDIDANKYRVDTGLSFVGDFDTYEEAQERCVRIVIDKNEHNRKKLIKSIGVLIKETRDEALLLDREFAELIVSHIMTEGWIKP